MSSSVAAMMGAALCSSCVLLMLCAFCMVPVQIWETQVDTTAPTDTTVPSPFNSTSFTVATATPCDRERAGERVQHTADAVEGCRTKSNTPSVSFTPVLNTLP